MVTVRDRDGRLLYRYRDGHRGRRKVLIDNRRLYAVGGAAIAIGALAAIAAPRISIPYDDYVLDYSDADYGDVYDTLAAPPISRLRRGYALDEVLHTPNLRDYMRRIDINEINFAFGSARVPHWAYERLEFIARAMSRLLDEDPDQVFLIEGHTDAVGSAEDNLYLSDRRAQAVAEILTKEFGVPPENLVTQGYGEDDLKIDTLGPSRANRRVAIRNITPLLARGDVEDDFDRDDEWREGRLR